MRVGEESRAGHNFSSRSFLQAGVFFHAFEDNCCILYWEDARHLTGHLNYFLCD